jgi:hypothetical protein
MVLYNVTVSIDDSVHLEWLEWMRNVHIPDVMATGLFIESKIAKVQTQDSHSYAISYLCQSNEHLQQYTEIFAPKLKAEHVAKFQGKFAAIRTVLDIVETYQHGG